MAIIGLNDQTGLSNISTTSTAPQCLLKGQSNAYLYQAGASEEVFKVGVYCGSAYDGDGNGVEIGVYDLGTGPTVDNATKIVSGIIGTLTKSAWNTLEITPVALTSGNWYAVGYRVISATDISLVRTSSSGTNAVNRHATLTGTSALPSTWDEGADLSYRYAFYAETRAASGSTLTDVDTDETIVPGQTGVIATGTNLSAGASARWVDANANVLTMTNYSASATAPTFDVPNLAAVLAAGVKFGSGDFEILDGSASLVATIAVSLDAPSGWQVHDVTDVSQAAVEGSIYYGLDPALSSVDQDQILLSSSVSIDSQGFLEFLQGVTSINYYVFDETDDTWGAMGVFSVLGYSAPGGLRGTLRSAIRSAIRSF